MKTPIIKTQDASLNMYSLLFIFQTQYHVLLQSVNVAANVRRYVALAQSRGGACFCTRGAKQGYDVICLFSRWQKPWHQGECPAGAGPAGWFLPGGFSR
jgi:hypothetical protein